MSEETLKQQVIDKVKACYDFLNNKYTSEGWNGQPLPYPKLTFEYKGRAAGTAWGDLNKINIHMGFLKSETPDMLARTVPHEVAHIFAYRVYGANGHDSSWKKVMRDLGLKPDRCHQYQITAEVVGSSVFHYTCTKCGRDFGFSKAKHNNMLRWRNYYICNRPCGGKLVRKGLEPVKVKEEVKELEIKDSLKESCNFTTYHCACRNVFMNKGRVNNMIRGRKYECTICNHIFEEGLNEVFPRPVVKINEEQQYRGIKARPL